MEHLLRKLERVTLAAQLFKEYHTRCFWHSPRDLVITEELVPFVAKGLRKHGGRRGGSGIGGGGLR